MKLGVSYIVFDGIELLEHSIRQIRRHVDFLQVIYQDKSWFGHPAPSGYLNDLERLKRIGLIDNLTCFKNFKTLPKTHVSLSKSYEKAKRQLGLDSCLSAGCTHYLCMDVDEFYVGDEFKLAKESVKVNGFTSTAVKFINYVNIPTVHRGYDSSTVPFICRIDNRSKMSANFFTKCDPTRGIYPLGNNKHIFSAKDISMHHMETVRRDLTLKYLATTRVIFNRSKTQDLVSNIKSINEDSEKFRFNGVIFPKSSDFNLQRVENIFNIPYDRWK